MSRRASYWFFISMSTAVTALAQQDVITGRLYADVMQLCSPEFSGRDVPGEGGDKAAVWIADQFRAIGMQPGVSDTGWFQEVPLVQAGLDTEATVLTISGGNWTRTLKWGEDFYIFPAGVAEVDLNMAVTFCSYGIVKEAHRRNDFDSLPAGHAAMVLPHWGGGISGEEAGRAALAPFKAAAAERAGAGMLLIAYGTWDGVLSKDIDDKIAAARLPQTDLPAGTQTFPLVHFNATIIDQFITRRDPLRLLVDHPENYPAVEGLRVRLRIAYRNHSEAHGFNVIGKFYARTDEFVAVSAHFDHLGSSNEASGYFPGANDNASGVAAMLEVCRMWMTRASPQRGLLAIAFCAEEDGLLGSKWFAQHPTVPRESIFAALNLDMIGGTGFASMADAHRPGAVPDSNYAVAYYSAAAPKLRDIVHGAGSVSSLNIHIQPIGGFHFSDAGSFHDRQIPTVHLFSGFDPAYNSENDTVERLNMSKLARMALFADRILINLSDEPAPIGFDPQLNVRGAGNSY